jgi:hypothetical protein
MDTYKCFPIWSLFLVQTTSRHSITVHQKCTQNAYRLALGLSIGHIVSKARNRHALLLRCGNVSKSCRTATMTVWLRNCALPDPCSYKQKKNSMASVRKRTIPTEHPPLVSEVSANFLRIEGAIWSAWHVHINYFYYLHISNSLLKLHSVFLKHPITKCRQ